MNKFKEYTINIIKDIIKNDPELTFDNLLNDLECILTLDYMGNFEDLFKSYKFDIMEYYFNNINIMKDAYNINDLVLNCIFTILEENFYQDEETNTIKQI